MVIKREFSFQLDGVLNVDKERLWRDITDIDSINYELMPLVKMTFPFAIKSIGIENVPLNQLLFKSCILLLGLIPIDVHYLSLENIESNHRFDENSSSWMHHFWKHSRILNQLSNSQVNILDTIHFKPRLLFLGYFLLPIYKVVFQHRHNRLKKKYNSKKDPSV
jgi:hypothetical protein